VYNEFFHLRTKPFELLPDPDFLYPSKAHRKALAYFEYGLSERSGFILLTGEVGSGKTTLIREMLKRDLGRMVLSKVFNTRVDSTQLVAMINDDFGLETAGRDKMVMLRDLNDFLIDQYAAGRRAVLVIDEAQNLSQELLEEVRMLSNLETDSAKLLQIILVGQPELRDLLRSPALVQLRQRIQVHCHIAPLSQEELREYVLFRLERAGNRDAMEWGEGVFGLMHEATRGIPRLVNILCDYVLLDAYAAGRRSINSAELQDLLGELDFERQFWPVDETSAPAPAAEQQRRTAVRRDASSVARRMMLMLQDLGQRLDVLERGYEKSGPDMLADMAERLGALEKRVTVLAGRVESLHAERMQRGAAPQVQPYRQKPERRKGWFRRVFGGD
jgi:putative secretion ATPase (PEP-CTERM system associated)